MRIINAMFSRGLGGIEQSFLDYCQALRAGGHEVFALIHPAAKIKPKLKAAKIHTMEIYNFGQWDIFSSLIIKKIIRKIKPAAILCHGNRSFALINRVKGKVPLVAVAHNYNVGRYYKADAVFAITEDLKKHIQKLGQQNVYKIPNMMKMDEIKREDAHNWTDIPLIGVLSRFVKKKGIDVFLHAAQILKKQGVAFHAIIAGRGEEEDNLRSLAKKLDIEDCISFPGWVEDKKSFYNAIDIFCLPSLHEPFGIVVLEAFAYGVPAIVTNSEGPSEIVEHGRDGIIVEKGNPNIIADVIKQLIQDRALAKSLGDNGYRKVIREYDISVVGKRIISALEQIANRNNG